MKPNKSYYNERSYGFIPWIVEPIRNAYNEAKRRKDNKRRYSECFKRGQRHMRDGNFAQAVVALEEAEIYGILDYEGSTMLEQAKEEAERTANYRNYYNKGLRLLKKGQAQEAIEAFKKALSYCKYLVAEETKSAKLQLKKAELLYEKLKQQYAYYIISGEKELKQKRYDKAIRRFKKALEILKTDEVKLKIKEIKKQEEDARRQKLYNKHYSRGLQYLSKGGENNYEKAIAEFGKALKYKNTKNAGKKLKEAQGKYKEASNRR